MAHPLDDLTGKIFGRLTVIERAGTVGKNASWRCACVCGGEKNVVGQNLKGGSVQSCGCWRREGPKKNRKHGESGRRDGQRSKEYGAWNAAKNRCNNPRDKDFKNWGGRGIRFEYSSFVAFLADVGRAPSPKHTIDRINNDGPYALGNCRWATMKEQSANKRQRNQWSTQGR